MLTPKIVALGCCLCLVVGCAYQAKASESPAYGPDSLAKTLTVPNTVEQWPLALPTAGDRALLKLSLSNSLQLPSAEALDLSQQQRDFSVEISANQGTIHAGVIVPHHLVAITELIATYKAIRDYNPDFVILLSPNHQKQPSALVTTGRSGILMALHEGSPLPFAFDGDFAAAYPEYLASDQVIAKEHGLYHQLPFILQQDWQAKILPLSLARNLTGLELATLRDQLTAYCEAAGHQKILWLASIDFSHYLPAVEAHRRDLITQEWIADRNLDAIAKSTEAHLDAPAVLSLMLLQFDSLGLIWHGNSATKLGYGFDAPGTSYMIYVAPPN